MLPGQKYTIADAARILRRRWWIVGLPLVVGLSAGVFLYRRVPQQFRSETLIMIVPQRIPDAYVKSVTTRIEDRLATISDQILSRSRLERIVHDLSLYDVSQSPVVMEDVVQRFRHDVEFKIEGKESFRVSYTSRDPITAQRVTERLAALYIEENIRDRENLAEDTDQFLQSQLDEAKRRLVEHERKLEQYRQRYAGQLPTQVQGNLQGMQNAQMQLQALEESTNRAQERRLLIERQLADAQTLPTPVAPVVTGAASAADDPGLTTAQQLDLARSRLDVLKTRLTSDHPDVKALERTIRDLEAKQGAEAAKPQRSTPEKTVVSQAEADRLRRIAALRADLDVVDHQLAGNQVESTRLKRTIADYQARLDAVPARESELAELTRDYATLQSAYTSLLTKHEDAKLAKNLEHRQIGEQFRVLDPASLPQRPSNQSLRLGVLAGSTGGGLLIGVAFILFLELRDSSLKREEDVVRVLTLPVLALIPALEPPDRRRRRDRLNGIAGGVLALACTAAYAFWKLRL